MRRILFLSVCLISYVALYAQEEKKAGDEMAAAGNYSGAAIMYRMCMESDAQCVIKLYKLILDEKIEPESPDELYRLINPLAQNENAEGQYYLGELYLKGAGGVTKDFLEALKWFRKSADKGHDEALEAMKTLNGQIGQTADELVVAEKNSDAENLYRLCMDNNEQCRLNLFKLINDGKAESQSADEPFRLINPLARQGNAEAQYFLGVMYRKGTGGVQQDDSDAVLWLQLSADQGFLLAQNELQEMATPAQEPVNRQKADIPDIKIPASELKTPKENLQYQKEKGSSKGAGILFAVGGVSIAAGAAAHMLLPTEKENWDVASETYHYYHIEKSYNPVYLIAGGVVGGVCIGTGIILKIKKNAKAKNLVFDDYQGQPLRNPDNSVRLNLVAAGNGAGFRLTF